MKNILVGSGFSTSKDSYKAGVQAAEMALKGLTGKRPTISYIFFTGDYDPNKISEGLKTILKDTEFIGGSADAVFHNEKVLLEGVVVASLYSEYLHVGVASIDNVSKDPQGVAKKTVIQALKNLPVDKYVDPYLLFTRMRNANVKWMVKIPSFFLTVFSRGMRLPKMGDETKIIKGIAEEIGLNVPIWGGSFGNSLEKLFGGKPYEISMLHSGKVMKDGLIIVANSCSLVYGQALTHAARRTNKFGVITGTTGEGYVVTEISGKKPVDWYCEQLNMKKEEFLKNTQVITQRYPLGIPDTFGNYIIRGAGVHNKGTLGYVAPLTQGWPVYIMDADPKYLMEASDIIKNDIKDYTNEDSPAITFAGLCASRRAVLKDKLSTELKKFRKNFNGAPLVGFSCFGEIGSKAGTPTIFQHLSANIFNIYDKLLHEVR